MYNLSGGFPWFLSTLISLKGLAEPKTIAENTTE